MLFTTASYSSCMSSTENKERISTDKTIIRTRATAERRQQQHEEEEEELERSKRKTTKRIKMKSNKNIPQNASGPTLVQEVIFLAFSALFSCLVLSFGLKRLDPNRQTSKAAEQRKKEIAKRLGRPNLQTNVYEDVIAADVANPDHINVTFSQIGGLEETKAALQELVILPLVRPELFSSSNLLKPAKGVLLYGPPGTGKTLLAKALAKEAKSVFINVRSSTLQSKWFGDAQKLVTAVFTLAWKLQPSIIFIDEIDSFLGTRKNSEHEAVTQMKTEFMTLWDGFSTDTNARVMVLAATNRPWDVDEAILRRLPRSFEVGLPNKEQRAKILNVTLQHERLEKDFITNDSASPIWKIAEKTEGYSGSDLQELCKQAAYGPVRDLLHAESRGESSGNCRVLMYKDFEEILRTSHTSSEAASYYQHRDELRKNKRSVNARDQQQDPEELKMMQQLFSQMFKVSSESNGSSGKNSPSLPGDLD